MTHSARNRLAIDLDDIERQLSAPVPPAPAPKSDPLSELARIVGQDDPFRSLLKPQAPARPADPAFDDLFAPRAASPAPAVPAFEDELAASLRAPAQLQAGAYGEPAAGDWDPAYAHQEAAPRLRSRRRGLLTVAAVLGVAALGVGTALVAGVGRPSAVTGDAPLIKAQSGPLKVQPENPGGVEIPNQNKQIYERAAAEGKTRVVNREEQPLDVAQATRQAPRAVLPPPAEANGAPRQAIVPPAPPAAVAATPAPAASVPALGEPRKVRTVAVRPDGTIVADAGGAVAPAAPVAAPRPVAPAPVAAAPAPRPAPAPPAPPTTTASTPARPAPTTTAAAPRPTETPRPAAPVKEQQRLAAVTPAAPAAVEEAPAPRAAAATGGFVVQLGVRSSEAQARDAFGQFRSKFGSALGGAGPVITQAQVNGNTVFRVRAGPMDRDQANEACSKVKAAGGDCFVAKN